MFDGEIFKQALTTTSTTITAAFDTEQLAGLEADLKDRFEHRELYEQAILRARQNILVAKTEEVDWYQRRINFLTSEVARDDRLITSVQTQIRALKDGREYRHYYHERFVMHMDGFSSNMRAFEKSQNEENH